MAEQGTCPLCGGELSREPYPSENAKGWEHYSPKPPFVYGCQRCGSLDTTLEVYDYLRNELPEEQRAMLAGLARERQEYGSGPLTIRQEGQVKLLLSAPEVPRTVLDKLDKVILFLGRKSGRFGQCFTFSGKGDASLAYCRDASELHDVLASLRDMGLISGVMTLGDTMGDFKLTVTGWDRFYDLQRIRVDSNRCFVAMSYLAEHGMRDVYEQAIQPAIRDAGYEPDLVLADESSDDIADRILAGIHNCRFVVADFTGHRNNVYFEAGFAMGLGRSVIFTCREDDWKPEKIAFDTRQYNHILWKNLGHLKARLTARIQAMFPKYH